MARILGISAFYHDSAAALVVDGRVVAAAQEERFTRRKADEGFPREAAAWCLEEGGLTVQDLDAVVFYDKPVVTFERLLSSYLHRAPSGFRSFYTAIPLWLKSKLWMEDTIRKELGFTGELLFSRHHISHAASAFYPSPFERAAIVTLDGVGEWDTTTIGVGNGTTLLLKECVQFPHSLGLLYSAFTLYCGFRVNSGEYKLMGLAPYGTPRFVQLIKDTLIQIEEDGTYRLNERYFNYISGLRMINRRFERLFGQPALSEGAVPTPFYMDIAASIQVLLEEPVLAIACRARRLTGEQNLVLAGGVALNSVANHRILTDAGFTNIWIQPAAGDAGGAAGAALYAGCALFGDNRPHLTSAAADGMNGAYLGPCWSDDHAEQMLSACGAVFKRLDDQTLYTTAAADLAAGAVVGWFQGRMEFGPRALGNRSILGDPRSPAMQRTMNLKIKYREGFRPFAPAVLADKKNEWFDLNCDSPYMLLVCPVQKAQRCPEPENEPSGLERLAVKRSGIPAVTHVDYSARIQTVHRKTNPRFHALLEAFEAETGCPVLINTSFNVRGEPIVCSPVDAWRCFLGTEMDSLAVGNLYLRKKDQIITRDGRSQEALSEWRKTHVVD